MTASIVYSQVELFEKKFESLDCQGTPMQSLRNSVAVTRVNSRVGNNHVV